ncbi:MAG: deoxyribodipyrimidine photo-lyase [Vulcanimicrobiaceae bacterium]
MAHTTSIVWFRRDLRLADHVALERAARAGGRIVCAFVLDPPLLRGPEIGAPIVCVFFDALAELRAELRRRGSDLALLEGDFARELTALAQRTGATRLFYNVDYVPSALRRDAHVAAELARAGVTVEASLDHVYFGADEIRKDDGAPYTVFTPYKRRWLERHAAEPRPPVPSLRALDGRLASAEAIGETLELPAVETYGHRRSEHFPRGGESIARATLAAFVATSLAGYAEHRNAPALAGTSHLSPQLRAGTLGIRTALFAAQTARDNATGARKTGYDTWISELVWRDFYQQILKNFPHVATEPFLAAAKRLRFRESPGDFAAWAESRTGYPIVDAAMTQLRTYGWMHNRLRMIVASFLTKDLLLDYRLGERFFEQHLADNETAANNGGWQWSASTGTDAAPYFRVFNPILQSKKFDPDGAFIRQMLPALAKVPGDAIHAPWTLAPLEAEAIGFRLGRDYPEPIVDHALARERALALYAPVLGKARS